MPSTTFTSLGELKKPSKNKTSFPTLTLIIDSYNVLLAKINGHISTYTGQVRNVGIHAISSFELGKTLNSLTNICPLVPLGSRVCLFYSNFPQETNSYDLANRSLLADI